MKSKYNILILGSGGREHAMAWKISQSDFLDQLHIAPGNGGTSSLGKQAALAVDDFEGIQAYAEKNDIDMIIVGPELPLVKGIVNHFDESPIHVIGPDAHAAQLEGSKAFAKEFMAAYDIPTAKYGKYSLADIDKAYQFLDEMKSPYVLKADGLAAGKGVLIIDDLEEAKSSLKAMFDGKFGAAGETVVIEEFLDGIEYSMFAVTDGKDYKLLPTAKDYKRIGEGDTGLNTGGMGAVSPVTFLDKDLYQKSITKIVEPTIRGFSEKGLKYTGFVFFGLIAVNGDPYVIEYNCRMGDPETEVVLPRLRSDLLELLIAIPNGKLSDKEVTYDPRTAAAVMLVSGGYPEKYEKGKVITATENHKDSLLYHAGTKIDEDNLLTNGGRVLAITSFGSTLNEAVAKSMDVAHRIQFEGKYFRTDIGFDL